LLHGGTNEAGSKRHDIGKVLVSETLLSKPGPLSNAERAVFHEHTRFGAFLLSGTQSPLLWMAREIAQCHHEHWDGGGYPDGLQGEAIPLSARIVMVADVYDALISDRPYKHGWSPHQALQDVCSQSGTQFDPTVVNAFRKVWMQKFHS
jgi:putative two-component system response regulator